MEFRHTIDPFRNSVLVGAAGAAIIEKNHIIHLEKLRTPGPCFCTINNTNFLSMPEEIFHMGVPVNPSTLVDFPECVSHKM